MTAAGDVAPLVLSLGWVVVVVVGCWRRRPVPTRLATLRPAPSPPPGRRPRSGGAVAGAARVAAVAESLGGWLRDRTGRPPDPELARRLGWAVGVTLPLVVVVPTVAVVAGVAVWCWPVLRRRRQVRHRADLVVRELPEIVDLLVLAVGAGLTVPLAVSAVGRRAQGPVAAELRRATAEVGLGRRTADALDDLPGRLGEPVRPLTAALVASERYGAPLHAALERLAVDARADRRRAAEEAARRVPVKLLFPLVLCTLPAFALLTVAPLIAGAVADLRP